MDRIGWDGQGGEGRNIELPHRARERLLRLRLDGRRSKKYIFGAKGEEGFHFVSLDGGGSFQDFFPLRNWPAARQVLSSSGTYLVASHIFIHSAFFLLKISNILALSECLSSV